MKTQPKVTDLVEILLTEITELKNTIQSTSNSQKQLEAQLEELSKTNIKVDTNEIDKKLSIFRVNLENQIQKINHNKKQEVKESFLQKSDFKLLTLTLISTFLFGISVILIHNQNNKIKSLKDQISFLLDDTKLNKTSPL